MKLGLVIGYSERNMGVPLELVLEAERLGYDACFTAEAYGSDAITPLTWIGANTSRIKLGTAIMQAPARTPAMCAMTAMTLDALSGGRFLLGIGPSGPQVVEGWYGVPYRPSLTRIKEYIAIVRAILRREAPVEFDGRVYQLPYHGEGATGLGKPLKSILHGRADMKIYTAAITPGGIRTAAEAADGFFPVFTDPERFDLFEPHIAEGLDRRQDGAIAREDFDILPFVHVAMGDDVEACFDAVRPQVALYVGGMGARDKNFYNDFAGKLGFEGPARAIQDLYLAGKRQEAAAAVPDALVDAVALCGPRERIGERLERWKASATTTLCAQISRVEELRALAELNAG
ncbi:MAG: LLM class F420-dependent oxidoreductase [Gammaproteobacteria bacterium]